MTPSVVVLCMGGVGHVQVLLPLVAGLVSRGCAVHVMTRREFEPRVRETGASFVDLYAGRPLEAVDAKSIPFPSRFVTFAATYAESLSAEVAELAARLIVYDTFTIAGPVVARRLGISYVSVVANHAPVPARMVAALRDDPRVAIAPECHAAVERLRDEHGMNGAHPFSYYETLSPHLNVYCEPAAFLVPEDRAALEPIGFFGSLMEMPLARASRPPITSGDRPRKIFVSFGTGVWRYYETAARAALESVSSALSASNVEVLVTLAGHPLSAESRAAIARPNVRIVDYVDQQAALDDADVFVTHHGINSTHESIAHQVPMISYPFFGDQPALARRCQDLGVAVPLGEAPLTPMTPIRADTLRAAIDRVLDPRARFAERLAEARRWEIETIADRPAVLERILALAGFARSSPRRPRFEWPRFASPRSVHGAAADRVRALLDELAAPVPTASAESVLAAVFSDAALVEEIASFAPHVDHVGFVAPPGLDAAAVEGLIRESGFRNDVRHCKSTVLAREVSAMLGVPVEMTIVQGRSAFSPARFPAVEVFVADLPPDVLAPLFARDTGGHVALMLDGDGSLERVSRALHRHGCWENPLMRDGPLANPELHASLIYVDVAVDVADTSERGRVRRLEFIVR